MMNVPSGAGSSELSLLNLLRVHTAVPLATCTSAVSLDVHISSS